MGQIKMWKHDDGDVTAAATTIINGSQKRITGLGSASAGKSDTGREAWHQAVTNLFETKAMLQNGAREEGRE